MNSMQDTLLARLLNDQFKYHVITHTNFGKNVTAHDAYTRFFKAACRSASEVKVVNPFADEMTAFDLEVNGDIVASVWIGAKGEPVVRQLKAVSEDLVVRLVGFVTTISQVSFINLVSAVSSGHQVVEQPPMEKFGGGQSWTNGEYILEFDNAYQWVLRAVSDGKVVDHDTSRFALLKRNGLKIKVA